MKYQYLRTEKNYTTPNKHVRVKRNVMLGVAVSDVVDGKLQFGWSVINPRDVAAIKAENREIKKKLGEAKRDGATLDISTKPEFDKKEAINVARGRLSEKVDFNHVPAKIRRQLRHFVYGVVGSHYGHNHIV